MKEPSSKALWAGLIFAVILGTVWQFYPLQPASDRIAQLPLNGIHYRGTDIPLTPFEEKFFSGVNVLKRIYQIDDKKYLVTILDGTGNRHVVHDPYYCFTGGGWEIIKDIPFKLPEGHSSLITIKKNNDTKEAMYWFTDGKEQYTSPLHYWVQATLRRLTLGKSGAEPVLVMIQPVDNTPVDWTRLLGIFPDITKI